MFRLCPLLFLALIASIVTAPVSAGAAPVTLIENGRARACIVLPLDVPALNPTALKRLQP